MIEKLTVQNAPIQVWRRRATAELKAKEGECGISPDRLRVLESRSLAEIRLSEISALATFYSADLTEIQINMTALGKIKGVSWPRM